MPFLLADLGDRMSSRELLEAQYGSSKKLRVRQNINSMYGTNQQNYFDWMREIISPKPGELMLDVGCGHGAYHKKLVEMGAVLIGADQSLGMAQEVQKGDVSLAGIQCSADALPFADKSFNAVLAIHLFHHIELLTPVLREFVRVLDTSGRIVVAGNAASSLWELRVLASLADGKILDETFDDGDPGFERVLSSLGLVYERHIYPEALLFKELLPLSRYLQTVDIQESVLHSILDKVTDILEREGEFRVNKTRWCLIVKI